MRKAWQGGPALPRALPRRRSLTRAKVASLTSERASLHGSTAMAWDEDKEKEAQKDVKVTEDELRMAREELQAVRGDLWAKMAALERARQEALETGNSMECLTEELGRLRIDLARQEALASQRGEVIAELKDEVCTQWASGWLAFQRRASRAFPDLEFNIQLSDEEVEGSASEAEVDAGAEVFPDRAPLPGDSRVPPGASSSPSPAEGPPFDSSSSASRGPTSGV